MFLAMQLLTHWTPSLLILSLFSGCGYKVQSGSSPYLAELGIRKIYIKPFVNHTHKDGVETILYNAVQKRAAALGAVKIVNTEEEADAVLRGAIQDASYVSIAPVSGSSIPPIGTLGDDLKANTFLTASLGCEFNLRKVKNIKRKEANSWTSSISRRKTFPANNQAGVLGSTSPLINESEFDRSVEELATVIAQELNESLLSMF